MQPIVPCRGSVDERRQLDLLRFRQPGAPDAGMLQQLLKRRVADVGFYATVGFFGGFDCPSPLVAAPSEARSCPRFKPGDFLAIARFLAVL